jgi:hypothetical protein
MKSLWSVFIHVFAVIGFLATALTVALFVRAFILPSPSSDEGIARERTTRHAVHYEFGPMNDCRQADVHETPQVESRMNSAFLYVRFVAKEKEGIAFMLPTRQCSFRSKQFVEGGMLCAKTIAFINGVEDEVIEFQLSAAFSRISEQNDLTDASESRREDFLRFFEQTEIQGLFKDRFGHDPCILAEYINVDRMPQAFDGFSGGVETPISL